MPTHRVNSGAALVAALFSLACGPRNPAPSDSATAASKSSPATPDPSVAAADRGRTDGDSSARTWVVIASDFQCPYCKKWHAETYTRFIDQYVRTGKVKVAYLNFPLGQHQNAVPTAAAAMCASAQGRFWQYHDALFHTQEQWARMAEPRPLLDSIARAVGVNVPEWSECVDSRRMLPLVMADRDRAAAAGVQSTPSFLVGDQILQGAMQFEEMRPLIDAAVAKSGSAPPR